MIKHFNFKYKPFVTHSLKSTIKLVYLHLSLKSLSSNPCTPLLNLGFFGTFSGTFHAQEASRICIIAHVLSCGGMVFFYYGLTRLFKMLKIDLLHIFSIQIPQILKVVSVKLITIVGLLSVSSNNDIAVIMQSC